MSIWRQQPELTALNALSKNTIVELLDIRFEAFDDESLTASMVIDPRTHQPYGLLHGGASVVLAETLGSTASYLCIDSSTFYCVGLEVNANHLRGLRSGRVTAVARGWEGWYRLAWGRQPGDGSAPAPRARATQQNRRRGAWAAWRPRLAPPQGTTS